MIVKTNNFEGPFDLILELVNKAKLNIEDIVISDITDQFIQEMKKIEIDSSELSDFIRVATNLLLLKTKSLIEVEEEEEELSREDLINRLIEYKKFKEVSEILRNKEEAASHFVTKLPEDLSIYSHEEEEEELIGDKHLLSDIYKLLMERYFELEQRAFDVDDVMDREEYAVEDYIDEIRGKLVIGKIISINELVNKKNTKEEIIVIFLSLLEMAKANYINILQDREDSILIESLESKLM